MDEILDAIDRCLVPRETDIARNARSVDRAAQVLGQAVKQCHADSNSEELWFVAI